MRRAEMRRKTWEVGQKCLASASFLAKTDGLEQPRAALDQPSRIPKSSMPYHSDMATGRGLAEVDNFENVRGAAVEADTYLGCHHRWMGDRIRMLKSTTGGTLTAASLAVAAVLRCFL